VRARWVSCEGAVRNTTRARRLGLRGSDRHSVRIIPANIRSSRCANNDSRTLRFRSVRQRTCMKRRSSRRGRSCAPEIAVPVAKAPESPVARMGTRRRAACVVLLVAWTASRDGQRASSTSLGANLDSKKPVVIYAGTAPGVYTLYGRILREMAHCSLGGEARARWTIPHWRKINADGKGRPGGAERLCRNGDVAAVVNVTALLNSAAELRFRMGGLAFEDCTRLRRFWWAATQTSDLES